MAATMNARMSSTTMNFNCRLSWSSTVCSLVVGMQRRLITPRLIKGPAPEKAFPAQARLWRNAYLVGTGCGTLGTPTTTHPLLGPQIACHVIGGSVPGGTSGGITIGGVGNSGMPTSGGGSTIGCSGFASIGGSGITIGCSG
jgi:hypothetical protein